MGTRCLTVFEDEWGKEVVVMYRQFDGYETGHGTDLWDFLRDMTLVNGLSSRNPPKVANGMRCLAAQVVAHFKDEPGGFYLYPAGTRDCGEEYIYFVTSAKKRSKNDGFADFQSEVDVKVSCGYWKGGWKKQYDLAEILEKKVDPRKEEDKEDD